MVEIHSTHPHPPGKDNCPFCQIIAGEREGYILKRNRNIIVLLSLEGHPLVIPQKHLGIDELTPRLRQAMGQMALSLLAEIPRIYDSQGANIFAAYGKAGGQDVYHAHIHVIPRFAGDQIDPFRGLSRKSEAERNFIADKF